MDNIVVLDKLDEFSTKLDELGQDLSTIKYNTQLLTGQQLYLLTPQSVAYTPYFVCDSALGDYQVRKNETYSLIKFKPLLDGTVKLYCKGTAGKSYEMESGQLALWNTFLRIKNLTTNVEVYSNAIYGTSNNNNSFSRESNIDIIKNNNYEIYLEGTNSGRVSTQNNTISLLNFYAATEITTKTIPNQIVKIN